MAVFDNCFTTLFYVCWCVNIGLMLVREFPDVLHATKEEKESVAQ